MANEEFFVSGGVNSTSVDQSIINGSKSYSSKVYLATLTAGLEANYPFKADHVFKADGKVLGEFSAVNELGVKPISKGNVSREISARKVAQINLFSDESLMEVGGGSIKSGLAAESARLATQFPAAFAHTIDGYVIDGVDAANGRVSGLSDITALADIDGTDIAKALEAISDAVNLNYQNGPILMSRRFHSRYKSIVGRAKLANTGSGFDMDVLFGNPIYEYDWKANSTGDLLAPVEKMIVGDWSSAIFGTHVPDNFIGFFDEYIAGKDLAGTNSKAVVLEGFYGFNVDKSALAQVKFAPAA